MEELEGLLGQWLTRTLARPEVCAPLVRILGQALTGSLGPHLTGALVASQVQPPRPERQLNTAQAAARVRRTSGAFRALYERHPSLRALASPPPAQGTKPHLRWPERQLIEWFRTNRPWEEKTDGGE